MQNGKQDDGQGSIPHPTILTTKGRFRWETPLTAILYEEIWPEENGIYDIKITPDIAEALKEVYDLSLREIKVNIGDTAHMIVEDDMITTIVTRGKR